MQERFWAKVQKGGGCWMWTGARRNEYGGFSDGARRRHEYAHRVAWQLTHGEIPAGMFVLHRCDTPLCVRPDHLFLGTHRDNMADMRAKGRADRSAALRTHCKRGHAFTPENTIRQRSASTGRPARSCRECSRMRDRKYYWAARDNRRAS